MVGLRFAFLTLRRNKHFKVYIGFNAMQFFAVTTVYQIVASKNLQ